VVSQARFDEWLKGHSAPKPAGGATKPAESPAAAGKAIFTGDAGCGACHKLSDAGTSGTVGPDLDQIVANAEKNKKAGQSVEDYIKESIVNPEAFVEKGFPAGTMPGDFGQRLSAEEIDALVKYLLEAGNK
jgi:mono/diheme cytochrome c family protein